jgi:hypothetical protein
MVGLEVLNVIQRYLQGFGVVEWGLMPILTLIAPMQVVECNELFQNDS